MDKRTEKWAGLSRMAKVMLVAGVCAAISAGALGGSGVATKSRFASKEKMKEYLQRKAKYIQRHEAGPTAQMTDLENQTAEADAAAEPAVGADLSQPSVILAQAESPTAPAPAPAVTPAPAQPVAPGEGPQLVFDKTSHDFGQQVDGKSLVCVFPFKNTGKTKLVINAVNTGCGCTAAKLTKQEFEPGEGSQIEITYNPKGSGKQQRSITVNSNDPTQPNMQLVIAAQVLPLFEARPNTLQFGTVKLGETRESQLVIVSRDKDFKVTSVETNGPEISAEIASPDVKPEVMIEPEMSGAAVVLVKLKNDAPVGRVLRQVTIKGMASKEAGASPEPQEVKITAFASITGEITVNPQLIRVPPITAGQAFEREVTVTREGNKPFQILKAEVVNSTLPGVEVLTEPFQEGETKGFKVKLKGTAGPSANNFRGSVMLTTDVDREQTKEIQFSGIVRIPPAPGGNAPATPGSTPQSAIPVTPTPATTPTGTNVPTQPTKPQ